MLILTRRANEKLMIGDNVEIHVLSVMGNKVRIGITAPREISVLRAEAVKRTAPEAKS